MEYFTFNELCKSDTAYRLAIDNTPPKAVKSCLAALTDNILDPLRKAWGKPIYVNSGYRCPALNKAVGGVASSQHLLGQAADITTHNIVDNARLFQLVQNLGLPFDQLIWEKGDHSGPSWIHVSYSPRHRREILKL